MTSSYIMLPGWSMDQSILYPLQSELSQEASVICADYRNIKSRKEITLRTKHMVEAVSTSAILNPRAGTGRDINKITLIGWSLGAIAALETAIAIPQKIDRLILIGGTACFVDNKRGERQPIQGWPSRIIKRVQRNIISTTEETLTAFDKMMFSEKEKKWFTYFIECIRPTFQKISPESLHDGLDYLLHTDLNDQLSRISVPTLLIHGEKDLVCPLSAAKRLNEKISQSQLRMIPDAGHIPFLTHSTECIKIVRQFCREEVTYDQ